MRLFFAYWPTAEKASEIAQWVDLAHSLYGGRKMRTDTLHMTLTFLGQAEESRAKELVDACSEWTLPSGQMLLHEPGRFHRAKVVWVGPGQANGTSHVLSWLYEANERLWQYLAPFGWSSQETGFRPHVSLLRNAGPGDLAGLSGRPVEWAPGRCVLVASRPSHMGSDYSVLAEVPVES